MMEKEVELLAACVALQMEASARGFGLRIADEAIKRATESRSMQIGRG